MIQLPNENRASEFKCYPTNWESAKADMNKDWFIQYRFYSPGRKPKQVQVKGKVNTCKNQRERKLSFRELIDNTYARLKDGFNPNHKIIIAAADATKSSSANTPLVPALEKTLALKTCTPETRKGMELVVASFGKAAAAIQFDSVPVSLITKRHVKQILEVLAQMKGKLWTPTNANNHRKYLHTLFADLAYDEAVESNPVSGIRKLAVTKNIKILLTPYEREKLHAVLPKSNPSFWRFMNIFYHLGGRVRELLRVKGEDINIKNQTIKIEIKKGAKKKFVYKVMTDGAIPYWEEALKDCGPTDYVFSDRLKPGKKLLPSKQISRRWYLQVKKKLGIKADFYALKHLHTDEVASAIGLEKAMKHNDHESKKTTLIYAVGEEYRNSQEVKNLKLSL